MDCKEIKPVNPKENQSWIFIGRTDADAPILWPPDSKSRLIRKDLKVGKIEGRRGQQRTRWSDGITDSMDTCLSKLQEMWRTVKPGVLQSMGSQSRTRPSDWTTVCVNPSLPISYLFICSSPSSKWLISFLPVFLCLKNYFPFTNIQILPLLWSFSPNLQCCWYFHSTFDTTHSHLGFPGGSDGK